MHSNPFTRKEVPLLLFFTAWGLLLPFKTLGQEKRSEWGEQAICRFKLTNKALADNARRAQAPSESAGTARTRSTPNKYVQVEPNQAGFFDRVSNIRPGAVIPITVLYPQGRKGEKVVVLVQDGGSLEKEKKVEELTLDSRREISFRFRATSSPGLFRIMLRKGNDEKVINLWVGEEPPVAEN